MPLHTVLQLETLELLSPQQTAQLLVLPLPSPEGKEVLINTVFDYLLEAPVEHQFQEVVYHTAMLAREVRQIFQLCRIIIYSIIIISKKEDQIFIIL